MQRLKARLIGIAAWWLWMPVVYLLVLGFIHVFTPGLDWGQSLRLTLQAWLWPNFSFAGLTLLAWLWIAIGLIGTLVLYNVLGRDWEDGYGSRRTRLRDPRAATITVNSVLSVVLALSLLQFWLAAWDNDKDEGRYYESATTFNVVDQANPPSSTKVLIGKALPGVGTKCTLVGSADVPACVKAGAFPDLKWSPRTAALESAITVMKNSGAVTSNVNLFTATVNYLPGEADGTGVWTGLLDGTDKQQPLVGVEVWDGSSNTSSSCLFGTRDGQPDPDNRFNRAFDGSRMNNLRNTLATTFPDLVYSDSDIWGQCVNGRPRIIIPVSKQIAWVNRTVMQPAGIIELTGSPSGNPTMVYHATVNAGEYAGPVYPQSIVAQQIDATQWASGRGDKNRYNFGYERSNVDTNGSNPGEYLMRSAVDGKLYYVTPLTPKGSSSQAIVAYAVVEADHVAGGLNAVDIYVLQDNDPAITNLNNLASRMQTYINSVDPGLLSSGSGGTLKEIIPLGDGQWRGFLDVRGITQAYIDLDNANKVQPHLVQLNAPPGTANQPSSTPGSSTGTTTGICGGDTSKLTASQVQACAQQFLNELAKRAGATAPATTPSGAPVPTPSASTK